jgi:hypothetical protein
LLFEASKAPSLAKALYSDMRRHVQAAILSAIAYEYSMIGQMRSDGKVLLPALRNAGRLGRLRVDYGPSNRTNERRLSRWGVRLMADVPGAPGYRCN